MAAEVDLRGSDLFLGVNELSDPRNVSDLEKKHVPLIRAPDVVGKGECFDLEVEVGMMMAHPSEHKHFVQFIDLYADETFLARADLTPARTCPRVRFCVALRHRVRQLRAYQTCNLHGTWVGRKAIAVEG